MKAKIIFLACLMVFLSSVSGAVIVRKNIVKAQLISIKFNRYTSTDTTSGIVTNLIKIYLEGYLFDEDGKVAIERGTIKKEYDFESLPKNWQDALMPIFKTMSRQFNKEFADEDTETF